MTLFFCRPSALNEPVGCAAPLTRAWRSLSTITRGGGEQNAPPPFLTPFRAALRNRAWGRWSGLRGCSWRWQTTDRRRLNHFCRLSLTLPLRGGGGGPWTLQTATELGADTQFNFGWSCIDQSANITSSGWNGCRPASAVGEFLGFSASSSADRNSAWGSSPSLIRYRGASDCWIVLVLVNSSLVVASRML